MKDLGYDENDDDSGDNNIDNYDYQARASGCSNKFEAPLAKRDVFTDTAFRHLSRDRFRDNSSFSTGS